MVHCLVLQAAEDALCGILKPMPLPVVRHPNATMEREPKKVVLFSNVGWTLNLKLMMPSLYSILSGACMYSIHH
jgi:hypothetical protein